MRPIIYINNEHCTNVNQLKDYFSSSIDCDSRVFRELLEAGRSGDIKEWLQYEGEEELAQKVGTIDPKLGDSEYLAKLSLVLTGDRKHFDKADFSKCFQMEDIKIEKDEVISIKAQFRKKQDASNETFSFKISSQWGSQEKLLKSEDYTIGEPIEIVFNIQKAKESDLGDVDIIIDNKPIKQINWDKQISSNKTERKTNFGVIPIFLVNEDIIKYWISSFSSQKYLLMWSSSECIDKEKLETFLYTTYGIKCDLVSAKSGTIRNFIAYAVAIINREIQKKCKSEQDSAKQCTVGNENRFIEDCNDTTQIIRDIILKNCDNKYIFERDPISKIGLNINTLVSDVKEYFGCTLTRNEIYDCKDMADLKYFVKSKI